MKQNSKTSSEKTTVRKIKTQKKIEGTKEIGKTGVFMVEQKGRYILVYCGSQICKETFRTQLDAKKWLYSHSFEVLPLMGAILAINMMKKHVAPKTMEELNENKGNE